MNLHIQFSRIQSAYIKSELICQCVCCKQELNFYSSFRLYLYSVRFVAKPSALFSSRPILKPGNILSMRRWQTETRTNRFFFCHVFIRPYCFCSLLPIIYNPVDTLLPREILVNSNVKHVKYWQCCVYKIQ